MDRRALLASAGGGLAALAGCLTDTNGSPTTGDPQAGEPDATGVLTNPSFEDGWAGWRVGRDLPGDPNADADRPVASVVGVSSYNASDGIASLECRIDGSQDDGTVWVAQSVDLSDYRSLAVDYLVDETFNVRRKAAVYTGSTPDESLTEVDFDTERPIENQDTTGWKTFHYPVSHDGEGIVAVGLSVVWETDVRCFIDNIRLSTDPAPTVK